MLIDYKNKSIKKVCTDAHEATKKHGKEMAEKIHHRIEEIEAADVIWSRIFIVECSLEVIPWLGAAA